jgi:hypothetical protein
MAALELSTRASITRRVVARSFAALVLLIVGISRL